MELFDLFYSCLKIHVALGNIFFACILVCEHAKAKRRANRGLRFHAARGWSRQMVFLGGHVDLAENGKGFQLQRSNLEMRELVARGLESEIPLRYAVFWIVIEIATQNQCTMDYKPYDKPITNANTSTEDAICEQ